MASEAYGVPVPVAAVQVKAFIRLMEVKETPHCLHLNVWLPKCTMWAYLQGSIGCVSKNNVSMMPKIIPVIKLILDSFYVVIGIKAVFLETILSI